MLITVLTPNSPAFPTPEIEPALTEQYEIIH